MITDSGPTSQQRQASQSLLVEASKKLDTLEALTLEELLPGESGLTNMTAAVQEFDTLRLKLLSGEANESDRVRLAVLAGQRTGGASFALITELVSDPSEEVRRYAVHALALERADRSPGTFQRLWDIAATDPDEDVRSMAVVGLGNPASGSRDRAIFSRLRSMLAVRAASPNLKLAIFEAMQNVCGLPPGAWESLRRPWRDLANFSVDWGKVDELEKSLTVGS